MMARGRLKLLTSLLSLICALLCLDTISVNAQSLVYPDYRLQSALLVQRDISLDIPISHILLPGINLTTSWFWTKNYTVDNITAISDLFNMGYHRFAIDVYWNNATSSFQLCPEQIVANSTVNATSVVATTITREVTTTVSSATTTFTATVTSTLTSSAASASATRDPLVPISLPNGYTCAPGANLQTFLDTIKSILTNTDNQLKQAGLFFLILNIRSLPLLLPVNSTTDLSLPTSLSLSNQINATLGDWLYTPTTLNLERQNINATFLSDPGNPIIDIPAYYSVNINNITKIASTPNGWPSTRHLFETQGRRLLIGFGTIDVGKSDYDTTQDGSIIFPSGTFGGGNSLVASTSIQSQSDICLGPQGPVFGANGSQNFNSSAVTGNYSFAISADPNPADVLSYTSVQSIVQCGLSPIVTSPLEDTFSGNSSPIDPISGTIWSWLPPNEPKNTSLPLNGTENVVACAALEADTGRWVVLDCNTDLSLACRVNNQAYGWEIGDETNYFQASTMCPTDTAFAVPRTPLENRFLLAVLRKTNIKSIWIDLNSLKAPDCWTTGNNNCPYGDSKVLVPIVASILVITVFTLMCLVKWQRYFQVRAARKRRRLAKGFLEYADYEGIPA